MRDEPSSYDVPGQVVGRTHLSLSLERMAAVALLVSCAGEAKVRGQMTGWIGCDLCKGARRCASPHRHMLQCVANYGRQREEKNNKQEKWISIAAVGSAEMGRLDKRRKALAGGAPYVGVATFRSGRPIRACLTCLFNGFWFPDRRPRAFC